MKFEEILPIIKVGTLRGNVTIEAISGTRLAMTELAKELAKNSKQNQMCFILCFFLCRLRCRKSSCTPTR